MGNTSYVIRNKYDEEILFYRLRNNSESKKELQQEALYFVNRYSKIVEEDYQFRDCSNYNPGYNIKQLEACDRRLKTMYRPCFTPLEIKKIKITKLLEDKIYSYPLGDGKNISVLIMSYYC